MKIFGFYHVGKIGRWQSIYKEQIDRIKKSGLLDISEKVFVGTSGDLIQFDLPNKYILANEDIHLQNGECGTLSYLHRFCQQNDLCKIWYIHTKGASHVSDQEVARSTESWRKYLEYFIIDKHKECIGLLDKYDVVSLEWRQCLFAGNFWWANSSHIKNLQNPLQNKRMEMRYRAEADFITLQNPKMKNLITLVEPSQNEECLYHKEWNPNRYEHLKFDGENFS